MSAVLSRFPIGQSDFRNLRENNDVYVDKSLFIHQVLEQGAQVMLFPRPRRFGKTLNLSMLRYFFEKSAENRRHLFQGLAIESSMLAKGHQQQYPVIFLTLKDLKQDSWDECQAKLRSLLADLYREHHYLLEGELLYPEEKQDYQAILEKQASLSICADAVQKLSKYLHAFHKKPIVLLLDEYDSPLHAAYTHGYYAQAIGFFRSLLSGVLKDNPYLFKGVVTGILRVAKESIFSGLNNLAVFSILWEDFSDFFGFTEAEVKSLTENAGHPELMEGIRQWYNGYLFGKTTIYNPWSVLNFLNSKDKQLRSHWVATSTNDLIKQSLFQTEANLQPEVETLLKGGTLTKPLQENVLLRDLQGNPNAVWNFLLFTGYLTTQSVFLKQEQWYGELAIPNREILGEFRNMTQAWFATQVGTNANVQVLFQALLEGNASRVEKRLGDLLAASASYHDLAGEQAYHAFVLGVLVNLSSDYEVRSNRESGDGRYDLMLLPKQMNKPGVVMELKVLGDKVTKAQATKALDQALLQLTSKDYAAELRSRGANPIWSYAIVFTGKQAWVKRTDTGLKIEA